MIEIQPGLYVYFSSICGMQYLRPGTDTAALTISLLNGQKIGIDGPAANTAFEALCKRVDVIPLPTAIG